MKRVGVLLSVFLVTISFAIAQTKMIAHRSHSGDSGSMNFNGDDNFGIPSSVDVFVLDTATLEKKWVHVPYGDADSAGLQQYGLRSLPYDTAFPRPDYTKIVRLNAPPYSLKFDSFLFMPADRRK